MRKPKGPPQQPRIFSLVFSIASMTGFILSFPQYATWQKVLGVALVLLCVAGIVLWVRDNQRYKAYVRAGGRPSSGEFPAAPPRV